MLAEEYGEYLKRILPGARYASGRRFILARCMECGDSKDPTHAHMYIKIPESDSDVSWFYCHKCKTTGVMTSDTLIRWGIFDTSIATYLTQHNKICRASGKNNKFYGKNVYRLYNNVITECRMSELKLKYINDRLGTNLSYVDCLDKKIVLNIWDLLNSNGITELTRDPNIVNQFNDCFLGFISIDNAFVNMRKLVKDGIVYKTIDKRYCRYNIFGKYDNTEKFYTIPCKINMQMDQRLKINIAEGEFDILSVYYNLRKDPNQIYTSIGGSNYIGILNHFIRTERLPYLELHIYPDNDKYGSNEVIKDIVQYIEPFGFPLYVHRNNMDGQKDFGVSPDKIRETIEPIKYGSYQ